MDPRAGFGIGLASLSLVLGACSSSDEDRIAAAGRAGGSGANVGTGGTRPSGGTGGTGGGTAGTSATGDRTTYGEPHSGQYHLGPVDFAESEWHNACAPAGGYRDELRDTAGLGGEFIAGVANEFAENGGVCDACILIETGTGRSIVARVVTYGVEQDPNDIDVSPSVYDSIHTGEYPRAMTWHFAQCPDTGPLRYEFQTEANIYWTSLWLRNPRVPISKVEVESANHTSFFALRRETDGTLNDDGGFGAGAFTFRITGMDGQTLTETLPSFEPGELADGSTQFE